MVTSFQMNSIKDWVVVATMHVSVIVDWFSIDLPRPLKATNG